MAAIIYKGKEAPIDVRNEAWYMRYFNVDESALNNLLRKNACQYRKRFAREEDEPIRGGAQRKK